MVNKWDIYFCNLNPTEGSEQQGLRPVIIVSNNSVNHNLPVSTVLPFSSIKNISNIYPTEILLPTESTKLPKTSVAMVQQIRTVSLNRLTNYVSTLNDVMYREKINNAIREYFEI